MNVLIPYALWGLLGLAVPIAIHLLSKREHDVVLFGTLRFLQPMESDTAKSIRLSNYVLLLCRLMLLALICYLMARPFIYTSDVGKTFWVERDILENQDYSDVLSVLPTDADIMSFTFDKQEDSETRYFESAWSFISFLNQERDSAVVYSKSLLKHYKGEPIGISNKIDWKIVPVKSKDSGEIENMDVVSTPWRIRSNENKTEIIIDDKEASEKLEDTSIRLQLINDTEEKKGAQLQELVQLSLESQPFVVEWVTSEPDWSIIVGDTNDEPEGPSIIWHPTNRQMVITQLGSDRYLIEGRIDREEVLRTNVPIIIASILNKKLTEINQFDDRTMDPKELVSTETQSHDADVEDTPIPLHSAWWLLILPVFVVERILSRKSIIS